MVRNNCPLEITGNTTLSESSRSIVINTTSSSTINLSQFTHDGVKYCINRIDLDISSTVTLSTTGNLIYANSLTSSNTYDIPINTYLEIISYDENWHIIKSISTNSSQLEPLFTTSFITNNNNSFARVSGSESEKILLKFNYNYLKYPSFYGIKVSVMYISGSLTGNLEILSLESGSDVVIATIAITTPIIVSEYTSLFSENQFNGIIDTIVVKFVPSSGLKGKDRLGINSIFIF